ncbi:CinA family protein [Microbacterium koreense]|uniref:CinA family protein n=1 Tax=Microbacterium koreense TaxID=323761 RepID=A0ABW2ZP47_9MICO
MDVEDLVAQIARECGARGHTVGAVESLTSGAVSVELGRGDNASEWYRGCVVAYHLDTKRGLLGLPDDIDPYTPRCAVLLAESGRRALAADLCVALTGVGGPEPVDEHPVGEVQIAVAGRDHTSVSTHHFAGTPQDVIAASTTAALRSLRDRLAR